MSELHNRIRGAAVMEKRKRLKINIPLMIMFAPVLGYFILFKYVPMGGLIIAFKDYNLADGIWGSPWVGFENFKLLFTSPNMVQVIKNTLLISVLGMVVSFPFPIILAILLNEVRKMAYKRFLQTLVYLPHFLNWVIIGSFVLIIFAQTDGVVNNIITSIGGKVFPFLYNEGSWLAIYFGSGIWKEAGFGAIIYLAALGSIDQSLYESASLDGANKFKQIWHITLPGLTPIIILMLILSTENIMEVGFDQIYVLKNDLVNGIAQVISIWSYEVGLGRGYFSLSTALGFFQSLIGLILVIISNQIARRFNHSLW